MAERFGEHAAHLTELAALFSLDLSAATHNNRQILQR